METYSYFVQICDFCLLNQSLIPIGFKGGDSSINQLLSITHKIYKSFDEGFEARGVFLDISKAFHRMWHDGLIFKHQENCISGKLLLLLKDF